MAKLIRFHLTLPVYAEGSDNFSWKLETWKNLNWCGAFVLRCLMHKLHVVQPKVLRYDIWQTQGDFFKKEKDIWQNLYLNYFIKAQESSIDLSEQKFSTSFSLLPPPFSPFPLLSPFLLPLAPSSSFWDFVAQAGLELRIPSASDFWVTGLKE